MTPRRTTAAIVAFIAVTVVLTLATPGESLRGLHSGAWPVLATFLVVNTVGEMFRIQLPGRLPTAPMSTAGGLALAATVRLPDGYVMLSSAEIVLTQAVAQVLGVLFRRGVDLNDPDKLLDGAVRLFSVVLAAVLIREVPLVGGTTIELASRAWPGWLFALCLIAVNATTAFIEAPLRSARRSATEHRSWRQATGDEVRGSFLLGAAEVSTAVVVSLTVAVLGLVAVPLVIMFLGLTQFALHRFVHVRETYRQSLRALASMPEVVGYVTRGHGQRVARTARLMARELRQAEREIEILSTASIIHDIGQLGLHRPLPRGATVQAAPSDQQRIADMGARLVRDAAPPEPIADVISQQAVPYHRVMEGRTDVPLGARILKVANAFDDYGGRLGAADAEVGRIAVERLYLGLGYEYDPRAVEALERVLEREFPDGSWRPGA
ncbi:MAG: HD domain-containing phosphohydrolase [Dermatophilaceae bacterium]